MSASKTIILSHPNTDFDAFAGMLAAQLLYPGARICLHAGVNRNVREFFNLHVDAIPHVEAGAVEDREIDRVVLVEVSSRARLGPLRELVERPGVEIVTFEHRPGERPADGAAASDAEVGETVIGSEGSIVTTMLKLIVDRGIPVEPVRATAFALGIHEDTGSLTFPSTTQQDVEALAWCLRADANQEMLARYLRGPLSEAQRHLLNELQGAARLIDLEGLAVVVTAVRSSQYVEDISGLVSRVGEFADWDALLMCVAMDGRTQIVARSRSASLNVDEVLKPFGGGGHPQAGSAVLREEDPGATLERLLERARAVAKPAPTAAEIMSQPVEKVDASTTIADALVELQRLGLSAVQLAEGEDLVGIVSREDLDRAVRHELGHAPAKGVMSAGVPVVGRRATLAQLRELLAEGRAQRLIVVGEDSYRVEQRLPLAKALGVVTSRDLLRALHEGETGARPRADDDASRALRERIGEIPRLQAVLPEIQRVAANFEGVYLVGGAVRDVLLGEPSLDIDLMVEGDAIAFAGRLAAGLGARSHPHEKFQTAVIKGAAGDGSELRVDVATARSEFYSAPGALPEVERATLRHDLARRDFTINAMAASLKSDDLGSVYDFCGGYRDLRAGVVRVLHNLSFIEDPSRIFRALRYETRLGFKMDAHTVSLARGCLRMRLLGDLSSVRLRDELMAILSEERIDGAIMRMSELGLDRAMHPALRADARARELIARAGSLAERASWGTRLGLGLLRLACLVRDIPADQLFGWLGDLRFKRADQDVVAACVTTAPRILEVLGREGPPSPSETYRLLKGQPLEVAAMALVLSEPDSAAVAILRRWLDELREVRLEISGGDLIAAGLPESRALGRALEETLDLKLDGLVEGRAQELETAKRLAARDIEAAGDDGAPSARQAKA